MHPNKRETLINRERIGLRCAGANKRCREANRSIAALPTTGRAKQSGRMRVAGRYDQAPDCEPGPPHVWLTRLISLSLNGVFRPTRLGLAETLSRFAVRAVHHVVVCRKIIKLGQYGSRFGRHDRSIRIVSGKFFDHLHRVPKRRGKEFDVIVNLPA
jgi:hypothetical protein